MLGKDAAQFDDAPNDDDRFTSDEESAESTQLLQLVGRGAFGSVYKALYKGRLAAVKVVEHDEDMLSSAMDINEYVPSRGTSSAYASGSSTCHLAMMEGAVSSALSHPHVVQTYDWQDTFDSAALGCRATRIVMEWCDAGSLSDALQDGRLQVTSGAGTSPLASLEAAALTLLEVAWALEYLHHMHIVHRDLKPTNVLLASSQADARGFTAKVSDFGLSRMFQPARGLLPGKENSQPEGAGTVTHMAPESLNGAPASLHGDVYAFGILMWEVYTGGRKPYGQLSKLQIMCGVVEDLRPAFPSHTPAWYSSLASACWAKAPRQRPSSSALAAQLQQQVGLLRQQARQAAEGDHKPRAPSRRAAAALRAAAQP